MSPRRDPGPLPEPLFDMTPTTKSRTENRTKTPPAFAYARCTQHENPKPVGLVLAAGHLWWRDHDFATWSKARMTCRASAQRLCDVPARPTPGEVTPACPCQESRT